MYNPKTIAEWFIHRAVREGEYLTQMKLQKLVYISHGWNLGLYDKPLIQGRVEAWKWGPVIPSLYREYALFGARPIVSEHEGAAPVVDEITSPLIEKVWQVYRGYTAAQLSDMTHRTGTPWSDTYAAGVRHAEIPQALIAQHYRQMAGRA